MRYKLEQLQELKSIFIGIFYLSEESYRCGLERVGLILRESMNQIQADVEEASSTILTQGLISPEELKDLFELLDLLRDMSRSQKIEVLKMLDQSSLKDVH